jgi:hypothetical protein
MAKLYGVMSEEDYKAGKTTRAKVVHENSVDL